MKICKYEPDLFNVTGRPYDGCYLINDFKDAMMDQPNEFTKLLNIVSKLVHGIKCSTIFQKLRHSETPCSMISLFDTGASKM